MRMSISYHIYYMYDGKVKHDIVHSEEDRKDLVFDLTHSTNPSIKFIGCIVTYLTYYFKSNIERI